MLYFNLTLPQPWRRQAARRCPSSATFALRKYGCICAYIPGCIQPITFGLSLAQSVQAAVDAAVAKFGGIDILVNNASAINLTGAQSMCVDRYAVVHLWIDCGAAFLAECIRDSLIWSLPSFF